MDICAIAHIESMLEEGKNLAAAQQYIAAIEQFDDGIRSLGTDYASSGVLDETGLKIVLANDFQVKNKPEQAAYIKQNTLHARIMLFKKKFACK